MAFSELVVQQVERARLFLIRDVVKELYQVNLIENNVISFNKIRTHTGSRARKAGTAQDGDRQQSQTATGSTPEVELLSVTLRFEGTVSVEEIEKAKNFARIHLLPEPDYTRSSNQLENQQEFNMVLESSASLQTSTSALLTFDPEYLEVTFEGPSSTVALARSKVVGVLDKYREQSRIDSSLSEDIGFLHGSHNFNQNLFLDNFVERKYNDDSSELSHFIINRPEPAKIIKPNKCTPKTSTISNVSQHGGVSQNKPNPNWQLIHSEIDGNDIECDATQSPISSAPVKSNFPPSQIGRLSIPSSDDESFYEENILTDPKYSKKIEQSMKLGYSEKQVMKALVKLGHECALNDLLSELIKLGASDNAYQSLSPEEPDALFLNDAADIVLHGGHTRSLESGGSSGFSSSADSQTSSFADSTDANNLRDVIIDGSNVAMSHGKRFFSCKGIQIAVNWFKERGHKNITAFVPQWRKETSRPDAPITDQEILSDLEKEGIVVFTPARRVKGRRVVCYDDRYILKLAVETDGIVVSNDVYRDLVNEREDFRKVVDQRLLMYSFVNDRFMPPEDPLGRLGPALDNFLRKVSVEPTPKPQDCPYGKKCTYGNKCRFYHPERGFAPQKLITETLKEQADLKLQERATRLSEIEKGKRVKQKLARTKSLVPWEPVAPASSGSKGQQDKPRLAHSKSLVLPTKSSDYLNECRKRLEEAELSAAMEKMPGADSAFIQQVPVSATPSDDSYSSSQSKCLSRRSSPDLFNDAMKQAVASSGDVLSKSSHHAKPVNTSSPLLSPHLTVPKAEAPERYLSGHLYLAKKLSDESAESNFFSEHTSSPSSTRTSSPVVPLSKIPEQTHSKKKQIDVTRSFTSPPPFHHLLYQQQSSYSPQTGPLTLDNIPHLSIFEQAMPHFPQRGDSIDNSPTYKQENVDSALVGYVCQNLNPPTPDSGSYPSMDPFLSPYQNPLQLPHSYAVLKTEQPNELSERLNLRRAFSSTGNVKTSDDLHQKLVRNSSGNSPPCSGDNQYMMKRQSTSAVDRCSGQQFGHSSGMNRQNSSSDPQMHVPSSGDLQYSSNVQHYQSQQQQRHLENQQVQQQQRQLENQQLQQQQRHLDNQQLQQQQRHLENQQLQQQQRHLENQQLQQQQRHLENQQLKQQQQEALRSRLAKQRTSIQTDLSGQLTVGQRSPVGGPTQNHYNPFLTPHFHPTTSTPTMMMTSPYTPTTTYLSQPHFHHQPPMMYTTQPDPSSQAMYTTQPDPSSQAMYTGPRRQSVPTHYTYQPNLQHATSVNPPFGYSDNPPITSRAQHPSMPQYSPEDAPIVHDDPRYTIYYHLSQLFPEKYVRRVMNLHRNERNPDSICKLILLYKEQAE